MDALPGLGEKKAELLSKQGVTMSNIHKHLDKLPEKTRIFLKSKPQMLIKRSTIHDIEKKLKRHFKELYVMGSYFRGAEASNDIDIVLIDGKLSDMKKVCKLFPGSKLISEGEKKVRIYLKHDKKFYPTDFFFTPKSAKYPTLLFSIGPAYKNIYMRKLAKSKGLLLNRYGLFKGNKRLDEKARSTKWYFKYLDIKIPKHYI